MMSREPKEKTNKQRPCQPEEGNLEFCRHHQEAAGQICPNFESMPQQDSYSLLAVERYGHSLVRGEHSRPAALFVQHAGECSSPHSGNPLVSALRFLGPV